MIQLLKKILDGRRLDIEYGAIDSAESVKAHQQTLQSNPVLQKVYDKWYSELKPAVHETKHLSLPMVELGCGASYIEKFFPSVIKSDVVEHINTQQVIDCEKLPFKNESVRALFLLGVFHHIKNPVIFLKEADRCLARGGRLVLLEPTNSPLNKLIINKVGKYEFHDDTVKGWEGSASGRLSNANTALASIVFIRDRKRFETEFPNFKFKRLRFHTMLAYFISGGMAFKPFIPKVCAFLIPWIEFVTSPLHRWLGNEMTIDLEKV